MLNILPRSKQYLKDKYQFSRVEEAQKAIEEEEVAGGPGTGLQTIKIGAKSAADNRKFQGDPDTPTKYPLNRIHADSAEGSGTY